MPQRVSIAICLILSVLCTPRAGLSRDAAKPTEYDVKAAYIYNFAKFVTWPAGAFRDGSPNIHVCVLGDDPFGPVLAVIEGKSIGDRKIGAVREVTLENVRQCEIVFISGSERGRLDAVLGAINGMAMLTVGDTRGFAQKGVMINFYTENDRVLFEINPKAAARAGMKISSKLLRIARIVGEP